MPDFWRHSGFHLLARDAHGASVPTDDLLRAYFARPEVAPIESSCAAERALFARLQQAPREVVTPSQLEEIADRDARDNYAVVLAFRDRLARAGTLEAAYRGLFADADGRPLDFARTGVPPLFVDQIVQMLLRGLFDGCANPFIARAAELFYREQVAHVDDGQIVLADLETVEARAGSDPAPPAGTLADLVAHAGTIPRQAALDVMDDGNAATYWERDELHDMALHLNAGRPGLAALCEVIGAWIRLLHGFEMKPVPVRSIDAARLRWYVGLDAGGTALLNGLYNAHPPDDAARSRVLCLMEATLPDHPRVRRDARGDRCHFALTMDLRRRVRLKPQNLLLNLPLGHPA